MVKLKQRRTKLKWLKAISVAINIYARYEEIIMTLMAMGIENSQEKIMKYMTETGMSIEQAYDACMWNYMEKVKRDYEIESLKEI